MRKNKFIALSLALSAFLGSAVSGLAVKQENASQDKNSALVHESSDVERHVSKSLNKKPVANSKKLSLWQLAGGVALGSVVIGGLVIKGPGLLSKFFGKGNGEDNQLQNNRKNSMNNPTLASIESPYGDNHRYPPRSGMQGYRNIEEIGGSEDFGTKILKAQNMYGDQRVCIKKVDLSKNGITLETAEFKSQIWCNLDHPNIVEHWASFVECDSFHIVTEFIEGQTLEQYLSGHGPLSEKDAIDLFAQISSAVKYCHDYEVLHKDLRPGNIMITEDKKIKLINFGLSKSADDAQKLAKIQAEASFYIAPEIIKHEPYSFPADIWSLGCILYEMVTGKKPFDKNSNVIPDSPSPIEADVSMDMKNLISCMLKKFSHQRITINEISQLPFLQPSLNRQ